MCNQAVKNYADTSVPNCHKTNKICNKSVDIYLSAIKFLPEGFETQEKCYKAVNACAFVFDSIPD